jgi:hypothetical protein
MTFESVKFNVTFKTWHLFIFILPYLHSRMREMQFVSQREMLRVNNSPSRHLQVGPKFSRRNIKSEKRDKIQSVHMKCVPFCFNITHEPP